MIIWIVVIVVLAVGVVANASKAFVHRRSLASWADGAAIVAAQYAAEDAIYAGPAVDELPISASRTRDAVADYVSRNGLRQRFEGFDVAVTRRSQHGNRHCRVRGPRAAHPGPCRRRRWCSDHGRGDRHGASELSDSLASALGLALLRSTDLDRGERGRNVSSR